MNTKYPLLWSALCLAMGIVLYDSFPSIIAQWTWLSAAGGVFFTLVLIRFLGRKGFIIGISLLFLSAAGMARMYLADESFLANSLWALRGSGIWTGVVKENPSVSQGKDSYARYYAELESIRYPDGSEKELSGTAFIYEADPKRIYRTGDRISVAGKMNPVRIYNNPGKIDLEGRYRSRRLLGRIYPDRRETIHYEGDSGKYRAIRWAEDIRAKLMNDFSPYMDPVRLHILMTLLFGGNYNEIPETIMNSFSATGIVHILSVSGSHVALLFGFLYFLGKWLHLPKRLVITGAILLVLFYSALSGLVPPVIRAALMGILSVGGVFVSREKTSLNLLGAAVTGMLLWDPYYLYDVSFQLSVGASGGILLFYKPLNFFLLKIPRLPGWVREGIALSLSAQVLTIPLILYDFHVFPLYFIPANLFVTPFLEWVIIAGLLASVLSMVFMPLAGGILQAADYLLWLSLRLNLKLSSFPRASLQIGGMTVPQIIFYYVTVLILWFKDKTIHRNIRIAAVGILWGGLLSLILFLYVTAPSMTVYCPDLGSDRGAALVMGDHKILYYKGSGIPSHTSNWEWNSLLGYEGLFSADLLILNLEEVKKPIPLTVPFPVKEIWVTGGKAELKAPEVFRDHEEIIREAGKGQLSLGNIRLVTNGSSWLISYKKGNIYISGRRELSIPSYPDHLLWVAGMKMGSNGYTEEETDRIHPEAIIYGGSRMQSSWEDMDLFEFKNYRAANVYKDGMQAASFDQEWKLREKNLWR
ncbi:ComEC/Rec2 family competence protein [Dialister sp.]|uniref:ComEC/Rec2 family competence protein n=1 Tax=Dialister sp. TaxID=1955814 RepID=UPI002E805557|nr:ComEC/Rec2 family competence protein [Dialister sp.]MEE3452655.1 ComEC/Rec2 family competence protein [Dialister sp.]